MVKRKKEALSTSDYHVALTLIAISLCFFVYIYLILHSHNQLGYEQQNTKLFITNKIKNSIPDAVLDLENSILAHLNYSKKLSLPDFSRKEGHSLQPTSMDRDDANLDMNPVLDTTLHHVLDCPHADLVTFWKPPTRRDLNYQTPYFDPKAPTKYVTFEPDVGGWNNIRMQMELVIVFAAATGRTLVLPPDQPMYLLNAGKGHEKAHNFADFFPFEFVGQRMSVITMEEFMAREGVTGGLRSQLPGGRNRVMLPPGNKTEFIGTEKNDRLAMWYYLRNVSACPKWKCMKDFVVIPPTPTTNTSLLPNHEEYDKKIKVFAAGRTPYFYDEHWQRQKVVHFISMPGAGYRLLEHFYTFIHFQDDSMDRYYKRLVRDYVHYISDMFCRGALIINKLLSEGKGRYSAFHIRRGEFQYKEVKIPAAKILENVGEFIPQGELVFIASDERNKTFFNDFRKRFPVLRYLDDYTEIAGLRDVNPNYLGMIDQIVCTQARIFVGTWFSTFSGYITRMRGYSGWHDHSVYYGDKKHRDRFQHDELPMFPFYMREWNISWVDIDEE